MQTNEGRKAKYSKKKFKEKKITKKKKPNKEQKIRKNESYKNEGKPYLKNQVCLLSPNFKLASK